MHARSFSLSTLTLLACSAAAAAQHTYQMDVVPANSNGDWGGSTLFGSLANTDPYQFDGGATVVVSSSAPPFGDFEITDSLAWMVPSVVGGEVPNPIPNQPPLGRIEMRDMEGRLTTVFPLATDPVTGDFLGPVLLTLTRGTIWIKIIGQQGVSVPFAGYPIPAFDIEGSLTQVGADVVLEFEYDEQFDIDVFGIKLLGFLRGDVWLEAPIVGGGMVLTIPPLTAGQPATATVANAAPSATSYLAYSVTGIGSTPVPQLNVVLDLDRPALAAPPTQTDPNGAGSWTFNVPPGTTGIGVWFQAFQYASTSGVPFVVIQ